MFAVYADNPAKSIRLGPMDAGAVQRTVSTLRESGWIRIIIHDVQINAEVDEKDLPTLQ